MKRLCLVLVIGFITFTNVFGSEPNNISVREVTGQGRNKDEAVKNGLYTAVSQVRGIKVGSGSYEFGYFGAGADVNNTKANSKRVEFDAVSVETSGTAYTTEIGGMVKSYEILEENTLADGSYKVKMKVWVYGIDSADKSKRLKVAIMPFKAMSDVYSFCTLQVPGENLSAILSQKIAVGLVESNKFSVLDRESIIDFVREKHLLIAFDSPLSEQAKLAETLGADYLLTGTIAEAKLERKDKYVEAIGNTVYKYRARFVFNYRLINGPTKQIVIAGVAERYLENEEIRGLTHEWNPADWDFTEIRDGMVTIIAKNITNTIVDRIFPIRIGSADANEVIIDQGSSRIAEGMLLDVFSQGKEVFDSDTKESIGKVENLVATLKITKVSQNISFGQVVAGDIGKITKGLVCRIKDTGGNYDTGMKAGVIRTEGGGVVLPFDKK